MAAIALAVLLLFQATPGFEAFLGDYQLVPAESDDIPKAVERVVEKMSFLTRGAARSRITAKCIAYPAVHIARENAAFRIHLEKGSYAVLSPGGPSVTWKTPEGETVKLRLTPEFRQIIEAKDGQRENHFSLTANRLVIHTKLSSPRLPAPVEYKLVYRRP
jgi:hypothetical protein